LLDSKEPDFPRIIASNAGALDGDTNDVSLIWVDRNSEIHILENLQATSFDPNSKKLTYEAPNDSIGGIIVDRNGKIAGLVSQVQDGIATVTQLSTILPRLPHSGREFFDFTRSPISKDKEAMLKDAAACLVKVHCKRNQTVNQASFNSNIEIIPDGDESSKRVFVEEFDANFKDNGQVEFCSLDGENEAFRLPCFLGYPGMTSIVEFPKKRDKSKWQFTKILKLGPPGNDRILVPNTKNSEKLRQVNVLDEYQIVEESDDYMIIERKFAVQSLGPNTFQWDIPAGFPFRAIGKFTYRYDKSLKLATSIAFEGIEQKKLSKDVIAPLRSSFEMISIPENQTSEIKSN